VVACNVENSVPTGQRRSRVTHEVTGRFPKLALTFFSQRCNQCDDPPCVPVCPTGASHVSDKSHLAGTVQITAYKCIKCRQCVDACPYDARFMNAQRGGIADKCNFCAHRLKDGKDPACVSVCPAKAMAFGDLDDPASRVAQLLKARRHTVLGPQHGTKPKVFYLV
jgi:Fe-S-cluster-containing dehydrogenase component